MSGASHWPSAVLVGLGNSILRDDAVGLLVARRAKQLLGDEASVKVVENERGGMDVLDLIAGYRRAVLVDAIKTGSLPPGSLILLTPEELPQTRRLAGLHDLDLPAALELADIMGLERPKEIFILAVEIQEDLTFGEDCTPAVAAAVEPAARVAERLAQDRVLPDDVRIHRIATSDEGRR